MNENDNPVNDQSAVDRYLGAERETSVSHDRRGWSWEEKEELREILRGYLTNRRDLAPFPIHRVRWIAVDWAESHDCRLPSSSTLRRWVARWDLDGRTARRRHMAMKRPRRRILCMNDVEDFVVALFDDMPVDMPRPPRTAIREKIREMTNVPYTRR